MTQTLYNTRCAISLQIPELAESIQPLRARDIMSISPLTIAPNTSVYAARALMQQCRIRHLPVVQEGRLVGMVSDRDIRFVLPSPATSLAVGEVHYLLTRLTVGEIMTRFVMAVSPECPVPEAIGRMLGHRIGALPVVENRQVVGILTRTDVLQAFLKCYPLADCA
jgi:acetoin utilization protein AcuB